MSDFTCPVCEGTGRSDEMDGLADCPKCKGKAFLYVSQYPFENKTRLESGTEMYRAAYQHIEQFGGRIFKADSPMARTLGIATEDMKHWWYVPLTKFKENPPPGRLRDVVRTAEGREGLIENINDQTFPEDLRELILGDENE